VLRGAVRCPELMHGPGCLLQVQLIFKGPLPPTPPDFRYRVTLPYGTKAAS
jgi:hypothetical protein